MALAGSPDSSWQVINVQMDENETVAEMKRRIDKLETENKDLHTRLDNQKQEHQSVELAMKMQYEEDLAQKENRIRQLEIKLQNAEYAARKIAEKDMTLQINLSDLKLENESCKVQLDAHQAEVKFLLNREKHRYAVLERDMCLLRAEKETFLKRLSQVASANLTYNNPDIADLSDKNKPTNLAQEFSELYDNEWTDVYDELGNLDDIKKIEILLTVLQRAFQIAITASTAQHKRIQESIALKVAHWSPASVCLLADKGIAETEQVNSETNEDQKNACNDTVHIPYEFERLPVSQKQAITEIEKHVKSELEKEVVDAIYSTIVKDMQLISKAELYVRKCSSLCWKACQHNPPIYIEFVCQVTNETMLKQDVYKTYSRGGTHIDFVVWPPLYLYQGGPMLTKGVAQGRGK